MKTVLAAVSILVLAVAAMGQTPAPSAFPSTTYNFALSPITLPGSKTSVAGAETDIKIKLSQNLALGETNLISGDYTFIGGRGDYVISAFSKWLQNVSPM